jgi:hypothetical protein
VCLLAEDYWEKGDLSRIRSSLEGWDERELARLLKTMEQETSDPEELKQLTRLRTDLLLPVPNLTLAELYRRREIGWSVSISLGLLLAAAVVRLWPTDWGSVLAHLRPGEEASQKEAAKSADLAATGPESQPELDTVTDNAVTRTEPTGAGKEVPLDVTDQDTQAQRELEEEGTGVETQEAREGEDREYAVKEVEARESADQVSVVEAREGEAAQPKSEGERESAPEQGTPTGSGEGPSQESGAGTAEEEEGEGGEEEADDLEGLDEPEELGDILSSIFEEEDETLRELAALSEGLDEIDIRDLVSEAKEISQRLRELNRSY